MAKTITETSLDRIRSLASGERTPKGTELDIFVVTEEDIDRDRWDALRIAQVQVLKQIAYALACDEPLLPEAQIYALTTSLISDLPDIDRFSDDDYARISQAKWAPTLCLHAMDVASRGEFSITSRYEGDTQAKDLVEAVCNACRKYNTRETASEFNRKIGASIDRYCQSTGYDLDNPTGIWNVRVDAVAQGWRRPRLHRPSVAPGQPAPLPTLEELRNGLIGDDVDDKREKLVKLVDNGMNLELALELAQLERIDLDA